ncbi:hypothetical protein VQ045_19145 [Aurantimonas sp. E1-2-R+4]|uniref:hypothetical protein n=1 Tax=Aurantimonas sp. E1-2-R+4 TaxID=3113714 RepID=UPI002F91C99A
MFAPPSGAEASGWANANLTNAKRDQLQWLFDNSQDETAAERAALTGTQTYGNTPEGFQASDATDRYGYDQSFAASTQNNVRDNARALTERGLMETGLTARDAPSSDEVIAAAMQGMPGEVDQFARDKFAPSETQVKGRERQELVDGGQLTDQMLLDTIIGEQSPVQTVGPDGASVYSTPGAAVRTGALAYINEGAQAKPENAQFTYPDGRTGPALQATDGAWLNARNRAPLEGDFNITKMAAPTGANEDVGIGRAANNQVEKALIDTEVARGTAASLRKFIASSPASQGAVGWLRGTAQNVVQTGGELGQFLGGRMAEVARDIESGAADSGLAGAFDPSIPVIEMLSNLLAFQYAKTTTGERLSNEMLRATKAALGLDSLTANQADALARLDQAIEQIDNQARILRGVRNDGIDSIGRTRTVPETSSAGSGALPAGVDPSDWQYMTPQERALFQ